MNTVTIETETIYCNGGNDNDKIKIRQTITIDAIGIRANISSKRSKPLQTLSESSAENS